MKLQITYTVVLETTEEKAPDVQKAIEAAVKPFDLQADVNETDCEELEEDEKDETE